MFTAFGALTPLSWGLIGAPKAVNMGESTPFIFCADICISGKLFGNLAEKGTRKDPILNWWSLGYSHSKQFSIYSLLDKVLFRSLSLLLLYNVAEKVANQICKALYSPKPHGNH